MNELEITHQKLAEREATLAVGGALPAKTIPAVVLVAVAVEITDVDHEAIRLFLDHLDPHQPLHVGRKAGAILLGRMALVVAHDGALERPGFAEAGLRHNATRRSLRRHGGKNEGRRIGYALPAHPGSGCYSRPGFSVLARSWRPPHLIQRGLPNRVPSGGQDRSHSNGVTNWISPVGTRNVGRGSSAGRRCRSAEARKLMRPT